MPTPVGDADDGERDQPQQRAAVGDDQEQRDHGGRREQQPEVGTVEDLTDVGLDTGGSGDLHLDPVGRVVAQLRAQVLDLVDGV